MTGQLHLNGSSLDHFNVTDRGSELTDHAVITLPLTTIQLHTYNLYVRITVIFRHIHCKKLYVTVFQSIFIFVTRFSTNKFLILQISVKLHD